MVNPSDYNRYAAKVNVLSVIIYVCQLRCRGFIDEPQ